MQYQEKLSLRTNFKPTSERTTGLQTCVALRIHAGKIPARVARHGQNRWTGEEYQSRREQTRFDLIGRLAVGVVITRYSIVCGYLALLLPGEELSRQYNPARLGSSDSFSSPRPLDLPPIASVP